MANSSIPPFSVNPQTYIAAAQAQQPAPMPGRAPVSSNHVTQGANPNPNGGSGTYSALLQQLLSSLGQSNNFQGLLGQMTANPAMAQQVGGLQGSAYTPQLPAGTQPYRVNWGGQAGNQPVPQQPQPQQLPQFFSDAGNFWNYSGS